MEAIFEKAGIRIMYIREKKEIKHMWVVLSQAFKESSLTVACIAVEIKKKKIEH